jgi:hypothetical protein
MGFSIRGKVRDGKLDLAAPLSFPEGEDVIVRIERAEPVRVEPSGEPVSGADDYTSLPFFGMWADRDNTESSVDVVRRGREQLRQRSSRPD